MIKKVMHFMFLSCLKATVLIEKKIHFRLSFSEKLQLKMHKSMCDACSKYEKQSLIIEKGIASFQKSASLDMDLDSLKKSITDQLKVLPNK
jgi:hypothetical protein